jgi:hypothetical protein
MIFPIIDASRYSIRDFESEFSRMRAWRYALWFRIARPTMVIGMWVLAALYLRWCVLTAQPGELAIQTLAPEIAVIVSVITAFVVWAMVHSAAEHRNSRAAAFHWTAPLACATPTRFVLAEGSGRRLMAYHDEKGAISHVTTVQDAVDTPS